MKKTLLIVLFVVAITGLAFKFNPLAPPVVSLSFQNKADMYLFQAQQGQGANLMGEATAGDTPVRTYWYDLLSSATDDGENVLKPTAVVGSGRWLKVSRAQAQADYTQASSSALDYIKNKPSIPSGTVTSVGITSTDFTVSGSPVTTSGNITANLSTTGITAGAYGITTFDSKGRALSGKRQETFRGTTNASGLYTVNYGAAYSATPTVVPSFITTDPRDIVMVTSSSTTGFTVQIQRRVDVVGLLPSYSNRNGVTVDVNVNEQ